MKYKSYYWDISNIRVDPKSRIRAKGKRRKKNGKKDPFKDSFEECLEQDNFSRIIADESDTIFNRKSNRNNMKNYYILGEKVYLITKIKQAMSRI